MGNQSSLATISLTPISEQPVSSSEVVRQFLVKFGELFGKRITPALVAIWVEELRDFSADQLTVMLRRVLRTFKADYGRTFPTVADVLQPAEESPAPQAEADLKWNRMLEFVRVYWSADLPGRISRGAPRITERTMTAIRAAGGLAWIAECSREQLAWCKKAFCESYVAWGTLDRDQYLLPEDSPIRQALSRMASIDDACQRDRLLDEPRGRERYKELAEQAAAIVKKYDVQPKAPGDAQSDFPHPEITGVATREITCSARS